jgi:hypothetical protein
MVPQRVPHQQPQQRMILPLRGGCSRAGLMQLLRELHRQLLRPTIPPQRCDCSKEGHMQLPQGQLLRPTIRQQR